MSKKIMGGGQVEVRWALSFPMLTLRDAGGGGQNGPLVREMSVISHMVMLWSRKNLDFINTHYKLSKWRIFCIASLRLGT